MVTAETREDRAWLVAAAAGDRAAFDALVRLHTPRMYRVALRLVGEPADAEDVVQEAWISAWRGLRGYRGNAAPATWLYRVVTNVALDSLRRRKPVVPFGDLDASVADRLADARGSDRDTPEGAVLRAEQVSQVHRAVAALEPAQRVPLVLREFEGLSIEEVAAVLEISATAVRSRLLRARQALLLRLKDVR